MEIGLGCDGKILIGFWDLEFGKVGEFVFLEMGCMLICLCKFICGCW